MVDRSLILEMLTKLSPERLGQLAAEAQDVDEGPMQQPLLGDPRLGTTGVRQNQQDIPGAYRQIEGRYF